MGKYPKARVIVLLLCSIALTHFLTTAKDLGGMEQAQETCLDAMGTPYVKQFANAGNCSTFWFCSEISPGIPAAQIAVCPIYITDDGRRELLSWNFYSCQCDYPWNTDCYDEFNIRHTSYRYNCATPLSLSVVSPGNEEPKNQ